MQRRGNDLDAHRLQHRPIRTVKIRGPQAIVPPIWKALTTRDDSTAIRVARTR